MIRNGMVNGMRKAANTQKVRVNNFESVNSCFVYSCPGLSWQLTEAVLKYHNSLIELKLVL